MSQIEEIIVELIESRIADYDFGRIIDDAISYNDDVQGHESRIDDLENIDVESTLTEFGDRIDELAELVRLSSVTAAAAENPPANQIDLIMPRNSLVLGYGSLGYSCASMLARHWPAPASRKLCYLKWYSLQLAE
jgi:hypothetical protein